VIADGSSDSTTLLSFITLTSTHQYFTPLHSILIVATVEAAIVMAGAEDPNGAQWRIYGERPAMSRLAMKICTILLPETSKFVYQLTKSPQLLWVIV